MRGGSIDASSAGRGRGSAFTVRLPIATAGTQKEETAKSPNQVEPNPLKILVVDDNENAAKSLGMTLEGDTHSVRVAFSGTEALSGVETFRPDLILMDQSDRIRSKAAGVDEHLVKPVDIDQLHSLMTKLCHFQTIESTGQR